MDRAPSGGMRTLGVDLAAAPEYTAACEINWLPGSADARVYPGPLDDDRLLVLIGAADKAGIDCPFGWPEPFRRAITAHAAGAPWPGRGLDGPGYRLELRFRTTDRVVRDRSGLWPLSVSTDRIGVPALRCAKLLDELSQGGHPVDRIGTGRVAEVYPAAALRHWKLPHRGYKRTPNVATLEDALRRLLAAMPTLRLDEASHAMCRRSDHAFDALICALVARAVALGHTEGPRPGAEHEDARVEGWIHLPSGQLAELYTG